MRTRQTVVFLALLALTVSGAARAETGYGWLTCEAGQGVATHYAVSSVFAFDYEYIPKPGTSERTAAAADQPLFQMMLEGFSKSDAFQPQVEIALADRFDAAVKEAIGVNCLSVTEAHGPHDLKSDAELWRQVHLDSWLEFREDANGASLEKARIDFTP